MATLIQRCGRMGALLLLVIAVGCDKKVATPTPTKPSAPKEVRLPLNRDDGPTLASLPAHAKVVDIARELQVEAPFSIQPDGTAVNGLAISLPDGARSYDLKGVAMVPVAVRAPGRYRVWLHCRWDDSCGNSVTVGLAGEARGHTCTDNVYKTWHWVKAGLVTMKDKVGTIELREREDGIAIDQIMLTTDFEYEPIGAVRKSGDVTVELKRFADAFDRSPGHGLGAWKAESGKWKIAFSYDPNRVANQYALSHEASVKPSRVLLDKPKFDGYRLSFSLFPGTPGDYGVILNGEDKLDLVLNCTADGAAISATHAADHIMEADDMIRLEQWHRIDVERWDTVLRVYVDGEIAYEDLNMPPSKITSVGLHSSGQAHFDDFSIESIDYLVDDGVRQDIHWQADNDAEWYRTKTDAGNLELVGKRGAIKASCKRGKPFEAVIRTDNGPVNVPRWDTALDNLGAFNGAQVMLSPEGTPLSLQSKGTPSKIQKVSIRLASKPLPDVFVIGPYHFTKSRIPDHGDYLDFTAEEYREMAKSPEADKLRRQAKTKNLIGGVGNAPWVGDRDRWWVGRGALSAYGPNATLRHAQEIAGDFTFKCKVMLPKKQSAFGITVGKAPAKGLYAGFSRDKDAVMTTIAMPDDDKWHDITVTRSGRKVSFAVDNGKPLELSGRDANSGWFLLHVDKGRAYFDDARFEIPRSTKTSRFYAFDRRETDWLRTGSAKWMDHAGIACAIASSWVSLMAQDSAGMLWNKNTFSSDVAIATNVEENTTWYGWRAYPESHKHYPMDNLRLVLASDMDINEGYRLEVNAKNRSATVIYRNGREVARVRQGYDFPMQYVGGHSPYSPRKSRIVFSKKGGLLRAVINGREVLRFVDKDPLPVTRVGLGGYRTRVNFAHIEVVESPGE